MPFPGGLCSPHFRGSLLLKAPLLGTSSSSMRTWRNSGVPRRVRTASRLDTTNAWAPCILCQHSCRCKLAWLVLGCWATTHKLAIVGSFASLHPKALHRGSFRASANKSFRFTWLRLCRAAAPARKRWKDRYCKQLVRPCGVKPLTLEHFFVSLIPCMYVHMHSRGVGICS